MLAMEMLIDGVCEEDSVPSGGKHASPFQPLFYCGSCGGVPLDCNLTGLR